MTVKSPNEENWSWRRNAYFTCSPIAILHLIAGSKPYVDTVFWVTVFLLFVSMSLYTVIRLTYEYKHQMPAINVKFATDDNQTIPNLTLSIQFPWRAFFMENLSLQETEVIQKKLESFNSSRKIMDDAWPPEIIYGIHQFFTPEKSRSLVKNITPQIRDHLEMLGVNTTMLYETFSKRLNDLTSFTMAGWTPDGELRLPADCNWSIVGLHQKRGLLRTEFATDFNEKYKSVALVTTMTFQSLSKRGIEFLSNSPLTTMNFELQNGPSLSMKMANPTNGHIISTTQFIRLFKSPNHCSEQPEIVQQQRCMLDVCNVNYRCVPPLLMHLFNGTLGGGLEICNASICNDFNQLNQSACNIKPICRQTFYAWQSTENFVNEPELYGDNYTVISEISMAGGHIYPIFEEYQSKSVAGFLSDIGGALKFWLGVGMTAIVHFSYFSVNRLLQWFKGTPKQANKDTITLEERRKEVTMKEAELKMNNMLNEFKWFLKKQNDGKELEMEED